MDAVSFSSCTVSILKYIYYRLLSVWYKLIFCWNGWVQKANFWHRGCTLDWLILHCVSKWVWVLTVAIVISLVWPLHVYHTECQSLYTTHWPWCSVLHTLSAAAETCLFRLCFFITSIPCNINVHCNTHCWMFATARMWWNSKSLFIFPLMTSGLWWLIAVICSFQCDECLMSTIEQ